MDAPIFINRIKHDVPGGSLTGLEILAVGGFGPDHDLFMLQGEGDPTGGTPIGLDQRVEIKPGQHYRAIPGNRNFGRPDDSREAR